MENEKEDWMNSGLLFYMRSPKYPLIH